MVINKVNINVYCNYNGTKRLNEKNPENTSYRKFWVGFGSELGRFLPFLVDQGSFFGQNRVRFGQSIDPIRVFLPIMGLGQLKIRVRSGLNQFGDMIMKIHIKFI